MKGNSPNIIGVKAQAGKNASYKHISQKKLPKTSQTFSFIPAERQYKLFFYLLPSLKCPSRARLPFNVVIMHMLSYYAVASLGAWKWQQPTARKRWYTSISFINLVIYSSFCLCDLLRDVNTRTAQITLHVNSWPEKRKVCMKPQLLL